MYSINKIMVYIVSGLILCPLALDLSLFQPGGADYIDPAPAWSSFDRNFTGAVAWGDVDGDGDLDLMVGNYGPNYLYINSNGTIPTKYSWKSDASRDTFSLAWVDFDSDGDLDLAAGNRLGNDSLYLNVDGRLLATPVWNSSLAEFTKAVEWGDIDSDGDLDLVVGHYGHNLTVYLNNGGQLSTAPDWSSEEYYHTHDIALADINNDGKLDLFAGNGKVMGNKKNVIFLNTGTGFLPQPNWIAQLPRLTSSVDFGDYDRDGDLDLAVGTLNQGTYVHDNVNNNITLKPTWSAGDTSSTTFGIAWSDITGNGYLDLILAVNGENAIYKNIGGTLENYASWHTTDSIGSSSIAVGDYDYDGSLDIAFGSDLPAGEPNKIYHNNGTVIPWSSDWSVTITGTANAVAWYDIDDDFDMDLAVGTSGKNSMYINNGGTLPSSAGWTSSDSSDTRCLTWGDLDGDGDLDLVSGNYGSASAVYSNSYGSLSSTAWWTSISKGNTTAVALADFDDDGDLDLAEGNKGSSNLLYLNSGSGLARTSTWSSNDTSQTNDLAWGDIDNDGVLDLAVANSGQGVEIYYNTGDTLEDKPIWVSSYKNDTRSVAWADLNRDGSLDLVTGAYDAPLYVYFNHNGSFNSKPDWQPEGSILKTTEIYLCDINGDGTMDILEVNSGDANQIYINRDGDLREIPSWTSETAEMSVDASFGDMDNDGDFDLAVANSNGLLEVFTNSYTGLPLLVNNPSYAVITSPMGLTSSSLYSIAKPLTKAIPIKYKLFDPDHDTPAWITPEYSVDYGGTWHNATRSETVTLNSDSTTDLTATRTGTSYTFQWDTKADNVVCHHVLFRISLYTVHQNEGVIQRPYMSTYTGPFPVASPKINPPLDLRVSDPTTSSLKLDWTERTNEDIIGYEIFMNRSSTGKSGPYELIKSVGKISSSVITDLSDGTTYYFKIRSYDSVGIRSIFSNIAFGTTISINLPPIKLKNIPDIEMDEDMKLFNYLDLNDYFWDELQNITASGSDGLSFDITQGENINVWINPNDMLNIEPLPNYFGRESFTVTARDKLYQNTQTFNVTVNSVNDRPILNLTDGFILPGIQNEWLNYTVTAFDPADPHDALKFSDNCTLFDIEAETGKISFNPLPWDIGTYPVNITVTDSGEPNLQSTANITVIINATKIPPKSKPPVSTLIYPDPDAIITTLKPTLMWDGRDDNTTELLYHVYLAPDWELVHNLSIFAKLTTERTKNTSMKLTEDLTTGIDYYWTVIPYDEDKNRGTCESGIWRFTTDITQAAPTVTLINPRNKMIINTTSVRLTWSLEYEGMDQVKYFVYMDTSKIPKTLIPSEANEISVDVNDLADGETYYWTVLPRAGNISGTCISGIWSFSVNLHFKQEFGVSLITSTLVELKINETKLHDATIVNEGNNVDLFLVTLSASTLQGSVSFQPEYFDTLPSLGSGFIELESYQAVTISIRFEVNDPALIGLHSVTLSVSSLGADYSDQDVSAVADIMVTVTDEDGNGYNPYDPNPNDNDNSSHNDSGISEDNKPKDKLIQLNNFNWCYLIFAILIAVVIILSYSGYLMRKTRKKFEVYKTAQDILESKKIDTASPLVAGFLAVGKSGAKSGAKSNLPDIELTPQEAATVKAAFVIGSGRYTQAQEDLSLVERPYSAAAANMVLEDSFEADLELTPRAQPELVPDGKAYKPKHITIAPEKPYSAAAKALPVAGYDAPKDARGIPIATPLAQKLDGKARPVAEPISEAYSPKHIAIPAAKPYGSANKMMILEQKRREGKISEGMYQELKMKYAAPIAQPAKPAYSPDYMHLTSEKPYDSAAKLLKLNQKLREGKISKRLYDELKQEYM